MATFWVMFYSLEYGCSDSTTSVTLEVAFLDPAESFRFVSSPAKEITGSIREVTIGRLNFTRLRARKRLGRTLSSNVPSTTLSESIELTRVVAVDMAFVT